MIAVGAVVAFVATLVLCPVVIEWLRRRDMVDNPVERSSHSVPTLRGGGLAPAVGAVLGATIAAASSSSSLLTVVGTALAFGALGLADDLTSVSAHLRLVLQLLLAAGAVVLLAPDLPDGVTLAILAPLAWIWLVAYVNAFNFMDGINGISAAQVIVAGGAWAAVGAWQDTPVVTAGGLTIALAALAFLPFNFPNARVFLGDVGSYFLGGWLAVMVVLAISEGLTPEAALAPLLLYVCDTGITLARRIARRESFMEPHREHTYQRLVVGGWSHARTTGFVGVVIAMCSALGAATLLSTPVRVGADVALAVVMVAYLTAPQWQSRLHPLPSADTRA